MYLIGKAREKKLSQTRKLVLCTQKKHMYQKVGIRGNFCKSTVRIKLHKKMDIYLPLKEISDDFKVVATCP